ncbi:hypothetical protein LAG90_18500 [Marinilongibacter aquaticus]|uniref:hypothetical protein n=1 Tax=Marinilongibacter aquaticus TaxID=2975157 RepID=UPI0021BDCCBD|nr:hypothetical protein [Marinilongibacter aquaticus]UBM58791.1 hypothetical protein LAG90_18500 [Marinilongibacter aquaticus]
MKAEGATGSIIDQILSPGKEGASNGTAKMKKGKEYALSGFYVLQGAKIKTVTHIVSKFKMSPYGKVGRYQGEH